MIIDRPAASQNSFLAWVVVLTSALFFFYIFIHMNMLNVIGDELSREFGFNAKQISQVYAAFTYGNVLFLLPAGLLLDRFSSKKLLVNAFLVAAIASYFFSMAASFAMMSLCRFIIGLVAAFSFLSAIKIASRWFKSEQMALVIGMTVTIGMLGGLVSQTPLAMVAAELGWRGASKVIAYLGLAIVLLQLLLVKDAPVNADSPIKSANDKVGGVSKADTMGLAQSIKMTLANRQNWFAGLYTALINLPVVILGGAWGVPHLVQVHQHTKTDATNITSMVFIGMMLGCPIIGWISDRLKLRKLPMIIGALLFIVVMAILIFSTSVSLCMGLVIYLLIGLLSGSQVVGYPVIAESNPPSIAATATSLSSILIVSGGMLVPIYGWLLDRTDAGRMVTEVESYVYSHTAFFNANIMMLVGAGLALIVAVLIKETYGKPFANR